VIHALLAANLAPVPIGTRLTYTVPRGGPRGATVVREVTVKAIEPCRVVVVGDSTEEIRADWPEWWQDGTLTEARP